MSQDALWKRVVKQWHYSYVQYTAVASLSGHAAHTAMCGYEWHYHTLSIALLIEAASDPGITANLTPEKTVRHTVHRRGVRNKKGGRATSRRWVAVTN